jgi:hypothetical protein
MVGSVVHNMRESGDGERKIWIDSHHRVVVDGGQHNSESGRLIGDY